MEEIIKDYNIYNIYILQIFTSVLPFHLQCTKLQDDVEEGTIWSSVVMETKLLCTSPCFHGFSSVSRKWQILTGHLLESQRKMFG